MRMGPMQGVQPKRERETEEEAAPNAGLCDAAAEVDVAIEPAGQGEWAEEADDREREGSRRAPKSAKSGAWRTSEIAPKTTSNAPRITPTRKLSFMSTSEEVQAKQKDERACNGRQCMPMGVKKSTYSARSSAERDEDHGKTCDKGKCGGKTGLNAEPRPVEVVPSPPRRAWRCSRGRAEERRAKEKRQARRERPLRE